MRLDIPFFEQTSKTNCGPTVLRMINSYFGEDCSIECIERIIDFKEGNSVSTIELAYASRLLGYRTKFFSNKISFNEDNLNLEFYKRNPGLNKCDLKNIVETAVWAGVFVQEKSINLFEILDFVGVNSVPIVLLDWNVVLGIKGKGYQGHFVPIVGYTKKHILVHNCKLNYSESYMKIPMACFEKSRKAQGTDEDLVVMYGNSNKK